MTRYSLYLHIPFCRHRCSYCDFNTYTTVNDLQSAYAEALMAEIRQVGTAARAAGDMAPVVHTIFFGGGTPTLMTAAQIEAILATVQAEFSLEPGAEITMEANPETVDEPYLAALRAAGVNRLSFGVQSVVPAELELLGRTHDFARVRTAVADARAAGFRRVNLDLIYGVPGQTLASWDESLAGALSLAPEHLSLYALTVEPGTPMGRWLDSGAMSAPDPDLAADQYELAGTKLGEAGFEQYEISNWSLPGEACRHNLTYWRNEPFLGLGAGAHGFVNGVRYQTVRQPRVYIRRLAGAAEALEFPLSTAVADWHREETGEAMATQLMMQLRLLREGLDPAGFEARFGLPLSEQFGPIMAELADWGLLVWRGGRLFLTDRGRLLSNQVFYRFLPE
ncbi:MAG: radical SAM family heme chaperone HemW [Ardenticatenales bacterium]|nr:radical SAM family heme chaperone HemW [Ardenticatenales bacterium]